MLGAMRSKKILRETTVLWCEDKKEDSVKDGEYKDTTKKE